MGYGVVFDVETSGLDEKTDEIIEISYLTFLFEPTPRLKVAKSYLNAASKPLSAEIKEITGLDDDLIRGESIPWDKIASVFQEAEIVIAHNAAFDVKFLKKYLPDLKAHFACSLRHIDWESKKKKSRDLISLAAHHGFLNPFPHRALFDSATLFRVVADYIPELLTRSRYQYFRVDALKSPFEKKDILKNRNYRWDGEKKIWWRIVDETQVDSEQAFLEEEIYNNTICAARFEKISLIS